jgi:hypothetical protein
MNDANMTGAGSPDPDSIDLIRKAFLAALLLTANVKQAEDAVVEAITLFDMEQAAPEGLVSIAVAAAVKMRPGIESPRDVRIRSSILPWELNSLRYLSPHLRHCFVLRILLGWSREMSAGFLQLETPQVDDRTRAAVARLTYIHQVFYAAENVISSLHSTNGFAGSARAPAD